MSLVIRIMCPLWRRLSFLVLAAELAGTSARAQPGLGIRAERVSQRPQIEALKPSGRVAELIARLSNELPGQREDAARLLLEMGPAIEPQVLWAWHHEEAAPTFPFLPEPLKSNRFELDPRLTQARYAVH